MRVAIIAGEESGDILASGLMKSLNARYPNLSFEGVGGDRMLAQGLHSEFSMERLSVMGLVEVLKRFPELYTRRNKLIKRWINDPPDLFIGVDAPDFNLTIEEKLKAQGVPTVHYVSPSVWAWRQSRLLKIERAVDQMLCFLPFESAFYTDTSIDARFVGHPLANQLPLAVTREQACIELGLDPRFPVVALLPGSRSGEVAKLAKPFLETAQWLIEKRSNIQFVIPAPNDARYLQIEDQITVLGKPLNITLVKGSSQLALTACDAVLIASGTATLEAMLCGKPMVVAYRMAGLTYRIISRLLKTAYVSLPNLLANEQLVPEILQDQVKAEVLGPLILRALEDEAYRTHLRAKFVQFSILLRTDADERAAEAVAVLIDKRCGNV